MTLIVVVIRDEFPTGSLFPARDLLVAGPQDALQVQSPCQDRRHERRAAADGTPIHGERPLLPKIRLVILVVPPAAFSAVRRTFSLRIDCIVH